jgi:transcription antitermination factor NusG
MIRSGALAGMQGVVVRHKNSARLVLTIELIMKSVAVEIDVADLEPLRPTRYPHSSHPV